MDVRAGEFLRINTPAFLFAGGAVAAALVAAVSTGIVRLAFALTMWWCASGAVMLFIDYRRKRTIFMRLSGLADRVPTTRMTGYISDTFCGRCIAWALRYRARRA